MLLRSGRRTRDRVDASGLDEIPLAAALDDARSLSLFASSRVIWIGGVEGRCREGARPRRIRRERKTGETGQLAAYLREPTPGTVVVLECSRYDFEGEDKAKMERVQKYFRGIPAQVEFRPFSPEAARSLAQALAKKAGLQLGWPSWPCCWMPREAMPRASQWRSRSCTCSPAGRER